MEKAKEATAEVVVEGSPSGELEIVKQAGERGQTVFEHRIRDRSPDHVRHLRTALSSCHWSTSLQVLDLFSLVCPTERQWEVGRKRLLDLINEEDRQFGLLVGQILGKAEQDKAEEKES